MDYFIPCWEWSPWSKRPPPPGQGGGSMGRGLYVAVVILIMIMVGVGVVIVIIDDQWLSWHVGHRKINIDCGHHCRRHQLWS